MVRFRADWIVPVTTAPIPNGWVEVDGDRILGTGGGSGESAIDLGHVAILPALVNAHTHLELSHLHRRVPPKQSFDEWVQELMSLRRGDSGPHASEILAAAGDAIRSARATGTGLMGDISNTLATVPLLRDEGMPAHVFHELIGFNAPNSELKVAEARANLEAACLGGDVRISLAPHAPYSVSPALFRAIREDLDMHPTSRSSVHLGESAAEVELLRSGTGAARVMLERLGVWNGAWEPPGVSPVEYLSRTGFLDSRVLVVHGVQFGDEDLERLRVLGSTVVSCPRSNRHVGVGSPPLEAFYAKTLDVAFGTDSLASVENLNMFDELAEARRIAPAVAARDLIKSATHTAARALGFENEFGAIERGKRAALIAVRIPPGVDDVEEFLVGGQVQSEVTWVGAGGRGLAPTLG
jgi:cytosine/adenosine deaminase-related metal-dependent hydrolase